MDTDLRPSAAFGTLAELEAWCRRAPTGTHLLASEVAEILASVAPESPQEREDVPVPPRSQPEAWRWRERVWTVPSETRLGVREAAEALGRPRSYVYARTASGAERPIPHRKMDGTLWFTAGELRHWIRETEVEVIGGPMEGTPEERKIHAVR